MTQLKHSVTIARPLKDVYDLASQVERYPDFLPGYLESRILKSENGAVLLQRKAIVREKFYQWQSWVRFERLKAIHFEHAAGPLKGMQVEWTFTALSPQETALELVHRFPLKRSGLPGWVMEKFYFAPRVSGMAQQVVDAFKTACEKKEPVLA